MNLRLLFCFFIGLNVCLAQENIPFKNATVEATIFSGSILLHDPNVAHLRTGRPTGFIASYNKKTRGDKAWEKVFNYPDFGYSFTYQDFDNEVLGENFALYAHYNFYFFKRNLQLRLGQGIGYTTNPYDRETMFLAHDS